MGWVGCPALELEGNSTCSTSVSEEVQGGVRVFTNELEGEHLRVIRFRNLLLDGIERKKIWKPSSVCPIQTISIKIEREGGEKIKQENQGSRRHTTISIYGKRKKSLKKGFEEKKSQSGDTTRLPTLLVAKKKGEY